MELQLPNPAFKKSYIEAAREFDAEGRTLGVELEALENDFGAVVQGLMDHAE